MEKTEADKFHEKSIENERLVHKESEALALSEALYMQAEIEGLEAALDKYGCHLPSCNKQRRGSCTCGLVVLSRRWKGINNEYIRD